MRATKLLVVLALAAGLIAAPGAQAGTTDVAVTSIHALEQELRGTVDEATANELLATLDRELATAEVFPLVINIGPGPCADKQFVFRVWSPVYPYNELVRFCFNYPVG